MSCEERRDAVLLFASGLLEEPEAAALRAHLSAGCASCAAHLDEARAVEAALGLASSQAAPLPALRAELLRRIDRVPRLAPAAARRRRLRRSLAPLVLAAGLAALLAAPLGWLTASVRYQSLFAEHERAMIGLQERQTALEEELAETRGEHAELDEEIGDIEARARILESDLERANRQVAMLIEPDLVTLDLRSTGSQPKANARVFWEWDDYYCYLHAEGLTSVEAPQVYALWLDTEGGNRILAGTFAPEDGRATLWVQLPRDMGRAVSAHVTLEPEAPGPNPAGPVQLTSGASRPS